MDRSKDNGLRRQEFRRDIECMRCGAPTQGRATCDPCFEAISELRDLARDFDSPRPAPVRHAPQPLARQGSNGSRRHRS